MKNTTHSFSTRTLSTAALAAALTLSATLASAQVEPVAPAAPPAPATATVPAVPAAPASPATAKSHVAYTYAYTYARSGVPAVFVRASAASPEPSPEPMPAPPEPPAGIFEGQPGAMGQSNDVKDDLFQGTEVFAKNATDVTEINMDPSSLDMVNGRHSARSMVLNVVRTYTYDKPGMYDMAEVEKFRAKLNSGDWFCSVHTRNFKTGSSSDVCNKRRTDGMRESAIITVEPRSLTFIHNIRRQSADGGSSEMAFPSGPALIAPMLAMVDRERLAGLNVQLAHLDSLDGVNLRLESLGPGNFGVEVDGQQMAERMAAEQKRMAEGEARMAESEARMAEGVSRINSPELLERMNRMQTDMQRSMDRLNSSEIKDKVKQKDEQQKDEKLKDKQENEQREQSRN
ncbi:hypothetical protein SAMN05421819_2249 [Bryocella elongata]|uniref:Uncharacterized protein n=1 Tax=Bryocella elongata TaxID=863522 RepID=A0A1H5YET9_9BACT|nr:hypothetical protein [Bryocella elongata]SEG21956.1 hypothetical protein SAMN05421819_2249 [Bryocella elongata]